MRKIVDGNHACARIAYLFSELATIYPITPSSPMASYVDALNETNHFNLFHEKVKVVEMQSEAGAAGAMHGALLSGSLATTFTASQGLLLMIPNMYKMAGERLPGVIHVASRTIATHALSIFGDHSDIYAIRSTGFCILASTNVEDAQNLAIVAHLSSIEGRLPFVHFFDGFRTSHELNTIEEIPEEEVLKLIPYDKIEDFKNEMLFGKKLIQKGLAENEDIYFQSVEARNLDYKNMVFIVKNAMNKVNHLTGKNYAPFVYYGNPQASKVIVAMGSVCDTIKQVVEDKSLQDESIGLIEVHLYRPFSADCLKEVLPKTVKRIAVLDRAKESGGEGEPLYLDVVASLKDLEIEIVGGRYGLSSKNTTPDDIYSIYKMLDSTLQDNFTIGIVDNETFLNLPKYSYKESKGSEEIKIYGFGSDGMVSASKDILKILGEKENKYVQGYFEYDSKKSGGITVSHLRFDSTKIAAPYYVTHPFLIVVTKEEYFEKYRLIDDIQENGILLINTNSFEKLSEKITIEDQKILKEKHIEIKTIDADSLAESYHLKGKINKVIERIILDILKVDDALEYMKEDILKEFKTKGEEVVFHNQQVIEKALENVKTFHWDTIEGNPRKKINTILEKIERREGYTLTTSDLYEYRDGSFPANQSKNENRKISKVVPSWMKENCIQCGFCALVCPHAVIRPILSKDEKLGIPLLENQEYNYEIIVSENDCTGCGLCIDACPGKSGNKALQFVSYNEDTALRAKEKMEYKNPNLINKYTIKGCSLQNVNFHYPGACAGCGETPYIKMLTALLQDELVIANATGCSSIYGGYAPSTPYSIPWANSLFEDNAEFAYGMHLAIQEKRNRLEHVMKEAIGSVREEVKEQFQIWLENKQDAKITREVQEKLKDMEIPKEIKENLNYIPSKMVWAIGGDGWAYDIGFGGLDHILSSNENIKVLVLDTEVYSNTGGQMSKSSHRGQVAEFADLGKRNCKKDLFRIAMCYPNCYVASINLGANLYQAIRSFKEAIEHDGPSIIIAYATCVEHGIHGGMQYTLKEEKKAVEVGYSLLMRYHPETEKLDLDSQEPNFEQYDEFLENETRYKALKIKNKQLAEILLNQNKEDAKKRYLYYKKISKKEEN